MCGILFTRRTDIVGSREHNAAEPKGEWARLSTNPVADGFYGAKFERNDETMEDLMLMKADTQLFME